MKILYLAPYVDKKIKMKRGFGSNQPAGNKKIEGMTKALQIAGNNVMIIAPLLLNKKQIKFFKKEKTNINNIPVVYPTTINTKYLNFLVTMFFTFLESTKWARKKENKFIIVYNYRLETFLVGYMIKVLFNKKLILEFEDGAQFTKEINPLYKIMIIIVEKLTKNNIDGFIFVNSWLNKTYGNESPSIVINGIYESKNEQQSKKPLSSEKKMVMYNGRLDYERGIEIFIQSIYHISSKFKKNLEFIITGYGPKEKLINEHIKKLNNLGYQVKNLGFLDENELNNLKQNASIFVNPQRTNETFADYSFPSKIFEYITYKKMIITSKVADIEEINHDNKFFTYNGDSPQNLAEAIMKASDINQSDSNLMIERATNWAREFEVKKISQNISNLLQKIEEKDEESSQ